MGIEALLQSQVIGLSSALAAKLNLSGGTLTGALSGTSISLSGSLTVAASQGITSANFTRISGSDQPTRGIAVRDGQLNFASNVSMYWSTSLDPTASAAGISLVTDGTSHFWQRSGATAQAYYLSNNYTDANHYERGFIRWNLNIFEFGTEAAGTGVARAMGLRSAAIRLGNATGTLLYFENAAGSPSITNYSNAGITVLRHDGNRGTLDCSDVIVDSGQYFYWRDRALMTSSANGVVHIQELQGDDSVGQTLCLGLATSPTNGLRLKRGPGSNLVTIRNGNDTADANIAAGAGTFSGVVILSALPTSNPGVTGQLWNDGGTLKVA